MVMANHLIDITWFIICAVVAWRFNRDLHHNIFNDDKVYKIWSADTNKVDDSGGPYYVKHHIEK